MYIHKVFKYQVHMLSHIITNLYVINFRLYQEYNTLSTRMQHSSYIRLNLNSLVTQCQDLLGCRGFLWHTVGKSSLIRQIVRNYSS
jgi:hypothetical protein